MPRPAFKLFTPLLLAVGGAALLALSCISAYAAFSDVPADYGMTAQRLDTTPPPTGDEVQIRDGALPNGAAVREYEDASGLVFAISWEAYMRSASQDAIASSAAPSNGKPGRESPLGK
ncbi:DUF2844 domain-containing protein [Oxalobacteraceae bacterium]|nr:DUF2844 domain-containing protein [Oxalobacteraceae bacterium]